MHCSFFVWPFVFEDSLKYRLFSVAKKYHLTYIDLKEVFDLSVSKKNPTKLELSTLLKDHDAKIMHQTFRIIRIYNFLSTF